MGDAAIIAAAFAIGHLARFGLEDPSVAGSDRMIPFSYLPMSVVAGAAWVLLLRAFQVYKERLLGSGLEEFRRIVQATFVVFGALGISSYLFKLEISRGHFLIVLPVGLGGLLVWHWLVRRLIVAGRAHGRLAKRTVIVGGNSSASDMVHELARRPELGMNVVGIYTTMDTEGRTVCGTDVPVLGTVGEFPGDLEIDGAEIIVVTGGHGVTSEFVRRLSWGVDPSRTTMIVAPSVVDIAGPRQHLRPVDGLSLLEIDIPRFEGGKRVAKRALDIAVASLLCVALLPIWLVVAAAIRLEDGGPIFYRQSRVGLRGEEFSIWKFRSMRVDADEVLKRLKAESHDAGNEVMFKMKNDPRVTRVGRFIRATSIDELPQVFNVLAGSMSLVGPRPPLPSEVAVYETDVTRKFLVKPGITGLWQVSGRSSLSWDDSVRLDLSYVENWTMLLDFQILLRTVRVVLRRDGAY